LGNPERIAIDSTGNIYVTDSNVIQKFNSKGIFLSQFFANDTPQCCLNAIGIAIDSSNNVYVADVFYNRILKFNSTGSILLSFNSTLSRQQAMSPQDVAVDAIGNIYVADTGNGRIVKFDPTGSPISSLDISGVPVGIAIDKSGKIYVTDLGNNRVDVFTTSQLDNNTSIQSTVPQRKEIPLNQNSTALAMAIKLATSSPQFQSLVRGYNYTFSSDFEESGPLSQGGIGLTAHGFAFELYQGPVEPGKAVKVVEVLEDPALAKILNVTSSQAEYHEPLMSSTTPTNPPTLHGQNNTMLSPLKQFKSGTAAKNVVCVDGLTPVIKAEDGSPACVKQDTAKILIERGWGTIAAHTIPNPSTNTQYQGIDKPAGIVSIGNQTYYMTTFNSTFDSIPNNGTDISFHDVLFTLFKPQQSNGNGDLFVVDAKFMNDNTTESLAIYPVGVGATQPDKKLSNHTSPQVGFVVYDSTIKLLVSTDNQASSALKLSLVTNSKTIHFGDSIWMEIAVRNTLSTPFMASEKNDWKFDASSLVPCSSSPVGISILDGYYTEENMTEGKQLSLYDNTMSCPYVLESTTGYQFEPLSSKIIDSCGSTNVDNSCSTKEMRYQVSFKGYWQGNLYPFDIGTHTIVGADEWGHVAIEHFTVTNPASIYLTHDNGGEIGIYKNGTVSGTKIIDVNINNFHQSRYPLIIQSFYTNGTLYHTDTIPSTSISPDGSYKYNFTISSSDQNAVYGSHKIIVTYNIQTAETIVGVPVPP
jgi:sugar lactone lactonase YvrE